eukprot:6182437-Pleurochrysis_carterae.AAC.4
MDHAQMHREGELSPVHDGSRLLHRDSPLLHREHRVVDGADHRDQQPSPDRVRSASTTIRTRRYVSQPRTATSREAGAQALARSGEEASDAMKHSNQHWRRRAESERKLVISA